VKLACVKIGSFIIGYIAPEHRKDRPISWEISLSAINFQHILVHEIFNCKFLLKNTEVKGMTKHHPVSNFDIRQSYVGIGNAIATISI